MDAAAGENSKELPQYDFQMVRYIWLSYIGMKHMESAEKKPKLSRSSAKKKPVGTHYAICVKNEDYPASLEFRKIYKYIPDKAANRLDMVRIIDESGEDYLYPSSYFVAIKLPRTVELAFQLAS
jgi:hypothetical protein